MLWAFIWVRILFAIIIILQLPHIGDRKDFVEFGHMMYPFSNIEVESLRKYWFVRGTLVVGSGPYPREQAKCSVNMSHSRGIMWGDGR